MKEETIAVIYARALVELGQEKNELDALRDEVAALLAVLEDESDMRLFIESPSIGKGDKLSVCERSLRGKLSDPLLNFLLLVIRKGREMFFMEILREFGILYDRAVGIVRAHVTTAEEMSSEEADAMRDHLAKALGKTVILETAVDADVLGGFVIRYDGMVADASLKSELDEMGDSMLALKFGSEMIQ